MKNSLRDKVFEREFELYLQFGEKIASIECQLVDLNKSYSNNNEVIEKLGIEVDELDFLISKSEILINEKIYNPINRLLSNMRDLEVKLLADASFYSKTDLYRYINESSEVENIIRNVLGIPALSEETQKLIKQKYKD